MRNGFITFLKTCYFLFITFAILLNLSCFSLKDSPAQNSPKKSSKSNTKTTSQKLFSNQDIIKLVKAEIEEDLIIAKINREKEVGFNLDADSLINLKQNRVSKNIKSAMINKVCTVTKDTRELSATPATGDLVETKPIRQSLHLRLFR
jgi:hypothetical protein